MNILNRERLPRVGVLGLLAVLALAIPYLVSSYTIHVANVAMIFAILAIGLFLTMGISGQINLAQVAFFGAGAYTTGMLTTHSGWGFWPAAVVGVLMAVVLGLVVGIPALRVQSHYLAIVTLGLSLAFTNWATNSSATGGAQGLSGIPRPTLPGVDLSSEYFYYYLVLVALVLGMVLASFIVHTQLGRRLRSMRDDSLAASAMGAEVPILRMAAFAFGGLYGGVAGFLYAGLITFIAPESFSLANMFFLLAMVIIGGRRSLWGSVVGAIGLVFLRESLSDFASYAQLGYGALVVLMVLFAPTGLAGIPERVLARLRGRSEDSTARLVAYEKSPDFGEVTAPGPDARTVVEIGHLIKDFRGLRALDDVTVAAREGEILGIVGPNGSGKTTLFNIISGLYRPTSGTIRILDTDVGGKAPYAVSLLGLARTFQNLRLFDRLTVRENVMVALDRTHTTWAWRYVVAPVAVTSANRAIRRQADELLARYGLADFADSVPSELSYGVQRRVEIARAMATNPQVLLLDEPAAGLNGDEVGQLATIVRDIRANGVTVMIIEHNMGLVMSLCDRVVVLTSGSVIADGQPEEVASQPDVIEAYLGDGHVLDLPGEEGVVEDHHIETADQSASAAFPPENQTTKGDYR